MLWQQIEARPFESLRSLAASIETEMEHGRVQGKLDIYPFARAGVYAVQSPHISGQFPQPYAQLPSYLPRFFGREEERARLQSLLDPTSPTRLVNLLGLGGAGKTRLAVETAETLQAAYGGRVYFTPLAYTSDPAHIGIALANSLSLPPCPGLDPLSQAAAVLHQAPSLLILDNLEHLLPHAKASIARTLGAALQIYYDMGSLPSIVTMMHNCAQLAIQEGEQVRAARLMGGASMLHKKIGDLPPAVNTLRQTIFAALRSTMDAALLATAWQGGEQFSLSEVVAHALQNDVLIP